MKCCTSISLLFMLLVSVTSTTGVDTDTEQRSNFDVFRHGHRTVSHIVFDTLHGVGNAFGSMVHGFGHVMRPVLGVAGGLAHGLCTSASKLLMYKVDAVSSAAIHVLNGGLDLVHRDHHHHHHHEHHSVQHLTDIIHGICGHCFFFCQNHHGHNHHHDHHHDHNHGSQQVQYHLQQPIITCPKTINAMCDQKSTSKVLTIPGPHYTDPNGLKLTLAVQNVPHNNEFQQGTTTVRYTVTNSYGLASSCFVSVNIKAKQCAKPSYIQNGRVTCTSSHSYLLLGESCTISCDPGYHRTGADTYTCAVQTSGAPRTRCVPQSCGNLPYVSSGSLQCPIGKVNGAGCYLVCPQGYSAVGSVYITCQSSGTWSQPGHCIAISHPTFLRNNCSETVTYSPVTGTVKAKVIWSAVFVDPHKGVGKVKVKQTVGPVSGALIGPGEQVVEYEAVDENGNKATCYFTVDAARAVRTCAPPSTSITDVNIRFTCHGGYNMGSVCAVTCAVGYSLTGSDHVTCTDHGKLDWTAVTVPSCQHHACPKLTAPTNGALSCDTWANGGMCQIQCQQGFTIPRSAPPNGMYACGRNSGRWLPNPYVMPCVASTLPNCIKAPGDIYYKGPCPSSSTALAQIKQHFIHALSASIYKAGCTNKATCNVHNVNVVCGPVAGRRQTAPPMQVKFEVRVPYSTANGGGMVALMSGQSILNKIAAGIVQAVKTGAMNYPQYGVTASTGVLHVDAVDMECPTGTGPDFTNGICAGCPKGQYYNNSQDTCDDTPKGFYQPTENSATYFRCPQGTSTEQTQAKAAAECLEMCSSGSYSPTGLVPCSLCGKGAYSDHSGRVHCTKCPAGYTTRHTGARNASSCIQTRFIADECLSSPCGAGTCKMFPDGHRCTCKNGYTGMHCETPPNICLTTPCLNGGTCVSQNGGFTCTCKTSYSGSHCQYTKLNGGWGSWSVWSDCSASCGQDGRRTRSRDCDSPTPEHGGDTCRGPRVQTEHCNQQPCPSCLAFPTPDHGKLECNKTGATENCTLDCVPGYSLTSEPLTSYECGPATGYVWSHELKASGFIPSCAIMSPPASITLKNTVAYPGLNCSLIGLNSKHRQDLTNQIDQQANKIACKDGGLCQSKLEVKCTTPDSEAVVELSMTVPGFTSGSLDLRAFFENKTVTPQLAKYLQGLISMELTGVQMNNYTGDLLSATVDNKHYTATSQGVVTEAECTSGSIYYGSGCVKCGKGTMQVGDLCRLCEVDTYQPNEGQNNCIHCQEERVTLTAGAKTIHDCIHPLIISPVGGYIVVTPNLPPLKIIHEVIQVGK